MKSILSTHNSGSHQLTERPNGFLTTTVCRKKKTTTITVIISLTTGGGGMVFLFWYHSAAYLNLSNQDSSCNTVHFFTDCFSDCLAVRANAFKQSGTKNPHTFVCFFCIKL